MRACAGGSGVAVVALGSLVLAGWALDSPTLIGVIPGLVAMNPTTAAAFVLAGMSLWLLADDEATIARLRVGRACALVVSLIALVKLASFLGLDLEIDQVLFRARLDGFSPPNRMAPNTTLNFLLTGGALLALDAETRQGHRPAQLLAALSGLTALFALIGYAYDVRYLYGVASYIPMALNTALAFALLSVGILCARPDRGAVAIVGRDGAGGVMVRRLLPAALGIPALLGWLRLLGERAGLYDTSFGVTLFVLLVIVVFAVLIWWTAGSLDRAEAERRAAEQALERLSHQLRLILDSAGEGIQGLDRQGQVTFVNPAASRLLGREDENLIGRPLHDLVHHGTGEDRLHASEACPLSMFGRDGDGLRRMEDLFRRADGTVFPVEYVSAPIREQSAIVGAVVAFSDITERRELDQMKEELISLVSHELRTPLTSILGFVELLLEGEAGPLADEQQKFLTIVQGNADRLMGLVNELLELSRIEAGRMELHPIALQLAPLIQRVSDSLRPSIEGKGQRLTLELADDLPTVWADADRVTQILSNLLSNAQKYTRPGGAISVAAQGQAGSVCVAVSDTGIGLTPAEQAQLFTKFFRARNPATQAVEGTGLGLAITRSLIELHGGRISVESAPGEGSTFSFTLPIAPNAFRSAAPASPVSAAGVPRPSGRVLVVDDEPDIADLMRRYLERGGYNVFLARSAAEGPRLARDEQPDLITLDVVLPDVDGFTALEHLKNDPLTAAIPVLLVSILSVDGRGKLLGAVDYLTKPVQERVLLARIARILADDQPRRILVADHNADVRALIAAQLRRAGHEVVEAGDGTEAVALARDGQLGLALIDVKIPNIDGLATLGALRAEPATRDLPVIMMTANPQLPEESRLALEALGATGVLSKPCTPDELAAVLVRHLAPGACPGNEPSPTTHTSTDTETAR